MHGDAEQEEDNDQSVCNELDELDHQVLLHADDIAWQSLVDEETLHLGRSAKTRAKRRIQEQDERRDSVPQQDPKLSPAQQFNNRGPIAGSGLTPYVPQRQNQQCVHSALQA